MKTAHGPSHLADDLEHALDEAAGRTRRDVPRELLRKSSTRELLLLAASDWCVILVCWAGMWALPAAWPVLALVVTSRLHAFGVILHDAAHRPLRGKPLGIRLLEVLCGTPLATTLNAMRYHHLRHHRDSGMPTDPYFKSGVEERPLLRFLQTIRGVALVPFWTVRPWFGLLALGVPRLRTSYARIFLQDRSGADLTHSAEVLGCARAELGQVVFQLPFALWLAIDPWSFLWCYGIPVTGAGLLAAWRLLAEHHYTPTSDRTLETILATTRDHNLGWTGWLLAPRNIGYHIVHHIHPQVGLRHLPRLRSWYLTHDPRYPG